MRLIEGDSLDVLPELEASSIDSIVTDPPYGIGFMGRSWDHGVPGVPFWEAALRVAKPGAYLVAFGGTRTFHRLTCAIEDAGWQIRDSLLWLYGSGLPKSLDVGKAIDKRPGIELHAAFARALAAAREAAGLSRSDVSERVVGTRSGACWNWEHHQFPEARHWPALRATLPTLDPSWGDVLAEAERQVIEQRHDSGRRRLGILPTKPTDYAVTAPATAAAQDWHGWGTALKPAWEPIVLARKPLAGTVAANVLAHGTGALNVEACRLDTDDDLNGGAYSPNRQPSSSEWQGKSGTLHSYTGRDYVQPTGRWPANVILDEEAAAQLDDFARDDVSRFFYCAKASGAERGDFNDWPTVKPIELMRWLVRLTTRPGGRVLDHFMGSGTTGVACSIEGMEFVGIDNDAHAVSIARRRLANTQPGLAL